jgi:hypothetical protein
MKKTTKERERERERYKKNYSAKKQLKKVSALHRCSGLGMVVSSAGYYDTIDGWMGLDSLD